MISLKLRDRKAGYKILSIISLFLLIRIPYLTLVPLRDARHYYDIHLSRFISRPFDITNIFFVLHNSFIYMYILALGQYLDKGNAVLLNLTNCLLGLVAIYSFYKIVRFIFADESRINELYLLTAIFAFFPVIVAYSLHFSPDLGVLAFFLLFISLLFYERFALAYFCSFGMIFSKETGLLLYLLVCVFYYLHFISGQKKSIKSKLVLFAKRFYFFFPLFFFILYAFLRAKIFHQMFFFDSLSTGIKQSLFSLCKAFSSFELNDRFFLNYLIGIFVLNFNWILTFTAVLFLVTRFVLVISKRKTKTVNNIKSNALYFIFALFICLVYLLTRYKHFLNLRYFLPIYPLLIIVFYFSLLSLFSSQRARQFILSALIVLLFISNFRTIDPISKKIIGVFNFGRHQILKLGAWDPLSIPRATYGTDELVYNLEYTNFHYIQDKIYSYIKPTENTYIVFKEFAVKWFYAGQLDKKSFKRTLKTENTFVPRYVDVPYLASLDNKPGEVYFIEYPNFDNSKQINFLLSCYDIEWHKMFENFGYSMGVYKLRLKA